MAGANPRRSSSVLLGGRSRRMTVCLSGCRQLPSRGRHLFGQKEERTPKRPFRPLGICGGENRTVPLGPTVRSSGSDSRIGPKVAHDARPAARAVVVEDRAAGRLDQVGQRPAVLVAADDGATVYWPVRLREGRDPPRQTPGLIGRPTLVLGQAILDRAPSPVTVS